MKVIEKGLSKYEFENYCIERSCELPGATYYGQHDEEIPFSGGIKIKRIYSEDIDIHIDIFYSEEYNDLEDEVTYTIYEED